MSSIEQDPSQKPVHPPHFIIEHVVRPNILALQPYRCARHDYQEGILLDANENALGHSLIQNPTTTRSEGQEEDLSSQLQDILRLDLHRYPSPSHPTLKSRIASLRGLPSNNIFLGVGSDEVIDLLIRVCLTPGGEEKLLITPPTYGMYTVCAQINDVGVVRVPLELSGANGEGGEQGRFSLRVNDIKKAIDADPKIKLIFLCSPGNPTGTTISLASIRALLDYSPFKGIVIVDEAYIDFVDDSDNKSAVQLVPSYANLCVIQTLSKSFGLAAIRLGIALAQTPLIDILTNAKAPYNISLPTAHLALSALSTPSLSLAHQKLKTLKSQRTLLLTALSSTPFPALGIAPPIGSTDANFLLVPILNKPDGAPDSTRAQRVYKALAEHHGVVVRYRGNEPGCTGCLRITVGTTSENATLLSTLSHLLVSI